MQQSPWRGVADAAVAPGSGFRHRILDAVKVNWIKNTRFNGFRGKTRDGLRERKNHTKIANLVKYIYMN